MKKIIFCLLIMLAFGLNGYCGQQSKLYLTDGSVVSGEILSYINGIYTVKTDSFGELKIGDSKVFRIESTAVAPPPPDTTTTKSDAAVESQIDSYKTAITANPEVADAVKELASSPQIQELANDPEVAKAAQAGDLEALMKNEKFMDLVNNPKLEEIRKKLNKQK